MIEAKARYREWKSKITPEVAPFNDVAKKLLIIGKEKYSITSYREYTNAYSESINNLIRLIERTGRGYSFEVLRYKVLFGIKHKKIPKYDDNK
ncbi:MAG: hypothetical protein HPY50_02715 [Firmicutes bacterium]|nr:hypothetical protein [Bacillota bacterium]